MEGKGVQEKYMRNKKEKRDNQRVILLTFLSVPLICLMTLVKTKTLKAAQNNPKVREMNWPFCGSKVCKSTFVPPIFPLSSTAITKDKCMLDHPLKEQH